MSRDPLEVADEQGYGRDEDGYPALHFACPAATPLIAMQPWHTPLAIVEHACCCARGERPRHRRAAEQRDERAPFHCPVPPLLPAGRIAHLSYGRRLLCCGISI